MTTSDGGEDHGSVTDADGVIRGEYDWSSLAPSTAVIKTVAIATNSEPATLEPLYNSVDADAVKYHGHGGPWRPCFVPHCRGNGG